MSTNKDYFIDDTMRKALGTLDKWLSKQPWKDNDIDTETAYRVRELITSIEDKGYYNDNERDILNGVRDYWFESKYGGKWICRYCLQSTKDVDYDYLSGQDHLECELKEHMGNEKD